MRVQLANVLSVLIPLVVTGCTSFDDRPGDVPLDLDDLWVITGYPCDGRTPPLLSRIKHFGKQLEASSLQPNGCSGVGQSIWTAMLPRARLLESELPVSFEMQLTLGAGNVTVAGEGTIASRDRMLLDVGSTPLVVTRATPSDAKQRETSGYPDGGPAQPGRPTSTKSTRQTQQGAPNVAMDASSAEDAGVPAADGGSPRKWYCLPFQDSCTCVADLGVSGDMCSKPKPSCCMTFIAAGQLACECWPPESQQCKQREIQAPDSKLVQTCPPR